MMFLLNDVVLRLGAEAYGVELSAARFRALTLPSIIRLGQELFAAEPLLHRRRPHQARRLAVLIALKAPVINATLFLAPKADCSPGDVSVRFVSAPFEVMADFYTRQETGRLDGMEIDKRLWQRLAA